MFSSKSRSEKYDYEAVRDSTDNSTVGELADDQELQPLSGISNARVIASKRSILLITWAVITIALIVSNVWLYLSVEHLLNIPSYENGFLTDLTFGAHAIELEEVRFTGGIKENEDGFYRDIDLSQPQYVGKPSPEIDQAWQDLYFHPNIFLTAEEEPKLKNYTYKVPGTEKFATGFDMYHSLHCINQIRMELAPDYYKTKELDDVHKLHIDHCLDYLRQSIQCCGDMTPAAVQWSPHLNRLITDFEKVHTCRNYKKLHEWHVKQDCGNDC